RRYLDIVRISYNRPIELTVDCGEELMDYYIIKQLLQPVVENAVLHGAKGMKCSEIKINVSKDDGDLVFVITNNGKPITEEEIQKALNEGVKSPGRRSYGLKNTVNRIKTYYGEQYGISIRGIEGVGTEVSVRIEQLADDNLKDRM
ncbi:MAG: sensor histidine kinase, partial [Clostridia bacterium]|nr:sensor histidine kinase [Clostridia bacterium]